MKVAIVKISRREGMPEEKVRQMRVWVVY